MQVRTSPVLLAHLLWEILANDFYRQLSSYFGSYGVDWSTVVNIVRVAEKSGGHTHRSVADVGNFDIYHLGYLLSHILPKLSVSIVWASYEKQWAHLTLRAWHSVHTMRARRRSGMTVDEFEDVGRLVLV